MFLASIYGFVSYFKYLILFFAVIFEGPIVMVASGFLYHNGFFDFLPMFFIICAGDLVGDVVWYYIGYYFAEPFVRKYGYIFSIKPEGFEKAKLLFARHHLKILLISKATLGLGMSLAILMAAGATKVRFRTYMLLNTTGELFLVSGLLAVGYFFSNLYNSIERSFRGAFVIVSIIIVVALVYGFTKYIKNKITL